MRSPFFFIVNPINGKRYDNTKMIGGIELIISTSQEDHKFANRYANVIELPLGYDGPIKKGAMLLVHHNSFKYYNDIKGVLKSGHSFFRDDKFFIEHDQFFMYKSDNIWYPNGRYCFVKPIPPIDSYVKKPLLEEPLIGIMKYPNEYLISKGIVSGDMVCFTPESEYEFIVDEEKLYRIFDHQITVKL